MCWQGVRVLINFKYYISFLIQGLGLIRGFCDGRVSGIVKSKGNFDRGSLQATVGSNTGSRVVTIL